MVTAGECRAFLDGLRPVLEARNAHWHVKPAPGAAGNGLMKNFGVAASAPCQKLRCHPRAVAVFAALYGTRAAGGDGGLAVSIDAPAVYSVGHVRDQAFSNAAKQPGLANSTLKPHVDQAKGKNCESAAMQARLAEHNYPFTHVVQGSIKCTDEVPRTNSEKYQLNLSYEIHFFLLKNLKTF